MEPTAAVLEAFGLSAESRVPLHGGEGRSWRVGSMVLKPVADAGEWAWLGQHLPAVRTDGFRVALPVPATDGRWVVDGWCAQAWLAGDHPSHPRWLEVIAVCEAFHKGCVHLPRPDAIDGRTDQWAVGDRVAWEEAEAPTRDPRLERLVALRRPVALSSQLIHGDLSENVLFSEDGASPAVIDPSPYWRPAGFASAIVVHDAVAWHAADPGPLVAATAHLEAMSQLFVRAAIYRLVTSLLSDTVDPLGVDRVIGLATELAG